MSLQGIYFNLNNNMQGRISKLIKERLGIEIQLSDREKEIRKIQIEQSKDYFERIFKEKETYKLTNTELFESFKLKYKEIFKREYDINRNPEQLKAIIYYFTKDVKFLKEPQRSFEKGLMLYGSYGLGKTSIMKAIRETGHKQTYFNMKSSKDIVIKYNNEGDDGIRHYISTDNFFFDDLGAEDEGNHYGKKEVFKDILESRHYEKKLTHVSTNLNTDQVRQKYGDRVFSRMFEMFNVIKFEGLDYRQKV